jgi:hypothetical protein
MIVGKIGSRLALHNLEHGGLSARLEF